MINELVKISLTEILLVWFGHRYATAQFLFNLYPERKTNPTFSSTSAIANRQQNNPDTTFTTTSKLLENILDLDHCLV
tara:strand:- start:266 stop:499 length:234 start_codon:yes stop_codon:yes gene_type:complete